MKLYAAVEGLAQPFLDDTLVTSAGTSGIHVCQTGIAEDMDSDDSGTAAANRDRHESVVANDISTMFKTGGARYVILDPGVTAITAGKLNLFVHYVISE